VFICGKKGFALTLLPVPTVREFSTLPDAAGIAVRGFLHMPDRPSGDGLVLTHGAGANCKTVLLVAIAEAFCEAGLTVLRCDLPFRQARPSGPPLRTAEKDQQGLRLAAAELRNLCANGVFLGGHSYGGRQASILAASDATVCDALLLLSYPLHPPKKPEQMRTAHFPNLNTPALFVSGSKDGFGTFAELRDALKLIPARTELLEVEGKGHELAAARTVATLAHDVVKAFLEFCR
jgi:predicted alpha/beta-hydrolase family hydrolase